MYLIIGQPTNRMDIYLTQSSFNLLVELGILLLYVVDIGMKLVRIKYDDNIWNKKFGLKCLFVGLLIVDQLGYMINIKTYPIRPFRLVRSCNK